MVRVGDCRVRMSTHEMLPMPGSREVGELLNQWIQIWCGLICKLRRLHFVELAKEACVRLNGGRVVVHYCE
jgi:hypothetical protein